MIEIKAKIIPQAVKTCALYLEYTSRAGMKNSHVFILGGFTAIMKAYEIICETIPGQRRFSIRHGFPVKKRCEMLFGKDDNAYNISF